VQGEAGVTVLSSGNKYKTIGQNSIIGAVKSGSNTWRVFGDLAL
jgi:hypothetical protein